MLHGVTLSVIIVGVLVMAMVMVTVEIETSVCLLPPQSLDVLIVYALPVVDRGARLSGLIDLINHGDGSMLDHLHKLYEATNILRLTLMNTSIRFSMISSPGPLQGFSENQRLNN